MPIDILAELNTLKEEKYRLFTAKLLPQGTALLGVSIPKLRTLAKHLIKSGESEAYLNRAPQTLLYQEELMLYALLLAEKIKTVSPAEAVKSVQNFVPYINSWAVCDLFCSALKSLKENAEYFYHAFAPYSRSTAEYEIRFFYVLALNTFLTEEFLPRLFALILAQRYVGFYDKMAVAWLLSMAYVKFPTSTEALLENPTLDKQVLQKTLSKICDSLQIKKAEKLRLRQKFKKA